MVGKDTRAGTQPGLAQLYRVFDRPLQVVRPEVDAHDLPEHLDRICRQHSVSFSQKDTLRQKQAFTFMSDEWEQFHDHARQSIESMHQGFKDDGKEGVASSGRRRVRGFAAAQTLVTIMVANFNLRKIAAFLLEEKLAAAEPDRVISQPKERRRDYVWDNAYTKTKARDSILDIAERGELESPLRLWTPHLPSHRPRGHESRTPRTIQTRPKPGAFGI